MTKKMMTKRFYLIFDDWYSYKTTSNFIDMNNILDSHFGVYGLIIENGKILTIRKNRGPYQDLLCLPGGTPKLNETIQDTLKREIKEETGADIICIGDFFKFDLLVTKDSFERLISFKHSG